jgi:hypothetical protein
MAKVKIGFLTTLDTNMGDDFIRDGIIYLLKKFLGKSNFELKIINKHDPYTLFNIKIYGVNKQIRRIINKLVKLYPQIFYRPAKLFRHRSVFDDCNFIIQSGAPVFWANKETGQNSLKSDWSLAFWKDVAPRVRNLGSPILNLAAGSCLKYGSSGEEIYENKKVSEFIRSHILRNSDFLTVRDSCAKNIANKLGKEAKFLPCTSIFAAKNYNLKASPNGKFVVFNYMHGGGHFYARDKRISPKKWENISKKLIEKISKKYEVKMLCHSKQEVKDAKKIAPGKEILFFKKSEKQLSYLRNALVGVCNRVHASMGIASLGIPSLTVTTDNRLSLISETGLSGGLITHFSGDKNLNSDTLYDELEELIDNRRRFSGRIKKMQDVTEKKYLKYFRNALKDIKSENCCSPKSEMQEK